jgi:hypothetical protein
MNPRHLLAPASLLALSLSAASVAGGGPSVELLIVSKGRIHQQRDASTVTAAVDGFPFLFSARIDGTALGSLAPEPVISGPIANPEPGHHQGVLGFNKQTQMWQYGFPNFDDWGVSTQGELDGLFANGTYRFTIAPESAEVVLAGDAYPTPASVALTGGAWERDSVYVVEPGDPVQLTTSVFVEWGANVDSAIYLALDGPDGTVAEVEARASSGAGPTLSLPVPGPLLAAGTDYAAVANFIAGVDIVDADPTDPGAVLVVAAYESITRFTVRVRAPEDLDADGAVNAADLAALLARWGKCRPSCREDIDQDGIVGATDLAALLAAWTN